MSDPRSPSQPPAPGTPEYNWLYGGSGGASDPDATEVMPASGPPNVGPPNAGPPAPAGYPGQPEATKLLPHDAAAAGQPVSPAPVAPRGAPYQTPPPPIPPNQPPNPPAAEPTRGRGRPREPRPKFRFKYLKYIVLAWLVFTIAVPIVAWNRVSNVDAFPTGDRPGDQPGTTYLLVGSDSRSAETDGSRTDTIMLLHTGSGPNLLMSIPRDSQVDIPGRGTSKINAAFAWGGPQLLVETIEQNTGIRIDDYVEIGFDGFADVVDGLGGVQICPTEAMNDPKAQLDIAAGCQEADGATALGYSRSRAFPDGDISRAAHQREVIGAIGKKAISPWTVVNPWRWYNFNFASARSIQISDGTSMWAMAGFARAMTGVSGDAGLTCVVPISNLNVDWDPERSAEVFGYIAADQTDQIAAKRDTLCTPKGLP